MRWESWKGERLLTFEGRKSGRLMRWEDKKGGRVLRWEGRRGGTVVMWEEKRKDETNRKDGFYIFLCGPRDGKSLFRSPVSR